VESLGAEIRNDPSVGAVLEGKIEAGDYEKFRAFMLGENGSVQVFLASPGGDLVEAMKIGRLVRKLKLGTVIPSSGNLGDDIRDKLIARHGLKDSQNFTCASACFFIFVAGIHRRSDFIGAPILGIHRPYFSEADLRELSSDEAILAANGARRAVESYMKELGVPSKYVEQMFSISKEQIRWIGQEEFDSDFDGFISELKDWVDAKCDKRTVLEKKVWETVKQKSSTRQTQAEKMMMNTIMKKYEEQYRCEAQIEEELALNAYKDELQKSPDRPVLGPSK
jgi:hypothetical protein